MKETNVNRRLAINNGINETKAMEETRINERKQKKIKAERKI